MQDGKYTPEEAVALIIASTRTRTRPVSINEIAAAIDIAAANAGSLSALADQIGLSAKMLSQFLQVGQLNESVRNFVSERKIDSVDAVSHLSRLQEQDQNVVAKQIVDGKWDTSDVRAYCELRALKPSAKIEDLISQVQSSKTVQEFVFEFIRREGITEERANRKLGEFIDEDGIKGVSFEGSKGSLILNLKGRNQLRHVAKNMAIPVRDIVPYLLYS